MGMSNTGLSALEPGTPGNRRRRGKRDAPHRHARKRIRSGWVLAAVIAAALSAITGLTQAAYLPPASADTGTVNYTCTTPYGAFTLPVTVTGSIPALLSVRQAFTLAGFQVQATVPASVVGVLEANGITSISGSTTIGVNAVNATLLPVHRS